MLDRVYGLLMLPNSELATTKQVAEFYGVSPQDINSVIHLNRSEVNESGVKQARHCDLKERLFDLAGSTKAWTEMRRSLGIASSATNLYPKESVLLIGFLLEDSEVAEKVRKLVLGINDDSENLIEPVSEIVQKEQYNMSVSNETKTNELTLDSRDVAEMVGRNHHDVIRDIRKIIDHLGDASKNAFISNYFIESTYTDGANRQKPCFNLTKKGCELFATRMTGAKGTQFAVTYIEKFNQMEEQLKSQTPVASYMIDNPIERAKLWIVEQEQKMMLETKVQEQVEVIEQGEIKPL